MVDSPFYTWQIFPIMKILHFHNFSPDNNVYIPGSNFFLNWSKLRFVTNRNPSLLEKKSAKLFYQPSYLIGIAYDSTCCGNFIVALMVELQTFVDKEVIQFYDRRAAEQLKKLKDGQISVDKLAQSWSRAFTEVLKNILFLLYKNNSI